MGSGFYCQLLLRVKRVDGKKQRKKSKWDVNDEKEEEKWEDNICFNLHLSSSNG